MLKIFKTLDNENFEAYAHKSYNNEQAIEFDELKEDLEIFRHVKKAFSRYHNSGIMSSRLILNHIIVLSNVFGVFPTIRMLFFKVPPQSHPLLKTFFIYLNFLTPHHVYNLYQLDQININDMQIDDKLWIALKRNEYGDLASGE